MPRVRVRLFAALRDLANASEIEAEASDVGGLLQVLAERYGARFAEILASGSVVVEGERAGRDRSLNEGEEVALLPPVSGGGPRPCDRPPARRQAWSGRSSAG